MAALTSLTLGLISPRKLNMHTYSMGQSTLDFASASFTGCISTTGKNVGRAKTSRTSQLSFALYMQPSVGCMSITTTSLKERFAQPLYRKRRPSWWGTRHTGFQIACWRGVEAKSVAEKSVVVVESPAKARTIEKYLGERHVVLPSFGHVRDVAAKAGSLRADEDFKLVWEVPFFARQHLNAIKAAIRGAVSIVLASDPDREGEAIAWHVLEMLKMDGSLQ